MDDQAAWEKQFEREGEDAVRADLDTGNFFGAQKLAALLWVQKRDRLRLEKRQRAEDAAQPEPAGAAERAELAAEQALEGAAASAAEAHMAMTIARVANRNALIANVIAIIATLAAAIALRVAYLASLRPHG